MKNFVKWFGIIAFAAVIGFSMVGCDLNEKDYEMLNGVWDRGDIVVTFNNDTAVFTQINSGSGWKQIQSSGYVKIGDKKFKSISKTGDLKWSCQELGYYTDYSGLSGWDECTITMDSNGQTLHTSNTLGSFTYTKK